MRKMWSFLLAALALTGCPAGRIYCGQPERGPQHLRRLLGLEHR